jgi:hypothetical protein
MAKRRRQAGPLQVEIREDPEANVVRAFFAATDGSWRQEVATMSLPLLEDTPGLFARWKELLTDALRVALEAWGVDVLGFHEVRPHEGN